MPQFPNQNPVGSQFPQPQHPPFIAQDDDSSGDESSEDGEDIPSDPEIFGKKQTSPQQEDKGKFEQDCAEECKVSLQEETQKRVRTLRKIWCF